MKQFFIGFTLGYAARGSQVFSRVGPLVKEAAQAGMTGGMNAIPLVVGKALLKQFIVKL